MEGDDIALMNDYRTDPMSRTISDVDGPDLDMNCEIVLIAVGGWPMILIVTTKTDHRSRHALGCCISAIDGI